MQQKLYGILEFLGGAGLLALAAGIVVIVMTALIWIFALCVIVILKLLGII